MQLQRNLTQASEGILSRFKNIYVCYILAKFCEYVTVFCSKIVNILERKHFYMSYFGLWGGDQELYKKYIYFSWV